MLHLNSKCFNFIANCVKSLSFFAKLQYRSTLSIHFLIEGLYLQKSSYKDSINFNMKISLI